MRMLCRFHLHDFAPVDLGRTYGTVLECTRCRYQVRGRARARPAALPVVAGRPVDPPLPAIIERNA